MTRANVVLLGGVCAVVGTVFSAALSVAYYALIGASHGGDPVPFIVGPLVAIAGVILCFLYALALASVYALVGDRSRLGPGGLVLSGLAFLAALSPIAFTIVYFLYHLVWTRKETVASPGLVFPGRTVDIIGDLLPAGAVLLLAGAVIAAGALGRWKPLLFVLTLLVLLPALPRLGLDLGWLPFSAYLALMVGLGACWVLLGVVLWRHARARDGRAPSPPAAHNVSLRPREELGERCRRTGSPTSPA